MLHTAHTAQKNENGFILLYVVISIVIFMALAISVVSTTITQVELGAQELAAVRATVAADMGLECINYYMSKPSRPFDTMSNPAVITCGPGMSFQPERDYASTACVQSTSSPYSIGPLPGTGSYAQVIVETWPRRINISGQPAKEFCAFRVAVDGCDGNCASASAVRTRWEEFGGFGLPQVINKPAASLPAVEELNDPEPIGWPNYGVTLFASSSAVLQVPYSDNPDVYTESNTLTLSLTGAPAGKQDPLGSPSCAMMSEGCPVINVRVKESDELLNDLPSGKDIDIQLTDMSGIKINATRVSGSGLRYKDSFNLTVGVPGGITPAPTASQSRVYLLRVTAHYVNDSSTVIIPLEIYLDTRGQL
jgi:hypothetical protein